MIQPVEIRSIIRSQQWAIVDCDIHNDVPNVQALFPYLSGHWQEYITQSAFRGPVDSAYPANAPTSARPGSKPVGGGPPGSDLGLLRAQTLDTWNAAFGILNCSYGADSIHNPDAAAAMASAVNDWQIAEWLEKEPRFRGSIVVPVKEPAMAAREIDRVGAHPGFVQVILPVRARVPYGNRLYRPIFEAATRHDLAIGLQFGGAPGNPPTAAGWPSLYLEEYAGMAQIFQTQLVSLIAEGIFEAFPTLRVALIEGGFTWLPSLMWRLDQDWRTFRHTAPLVKQAPSTYIREHVRLTLQPIHSSPDPHYIVEIVDQMDSEALLMFSTDYPHLQFETPEEAVPPSLPESLTQKILSDNARAFYRL